MHEVLVNRLGGLSLPRKSVVKLTDRLDMIVDDYCGRNKKKTLQCLKSKWFRMVSVQILLEQTLCFMHIFLGVGQFYFFDN